MRTAPVLAAAAVLLVTAHLLAQQGPPPGAGPGPGPGGPGVGPGPGGPGPGGPAGRGVQALPGLTVAQQQAFQDGVRTFGRRYTVADGLGPVFNDESCAACHPAGGGSNRRVTRIGLQGDRDFDPLTHLGGSLIQDRGIGEVTVGGETVAFTGESVPAEANVVARRRSQSLLGLGFVDATPDATWLAIAAEQEAADPAIAGRAPLVVDPFTGDVVVGRFGWKGQVPSLRAFAADALLNELGVTSPRFADEVCPQGDCLRLGFNPTPALNDDGRDVEALTDFMRMLAAPGRGDTSEDAAAGEVLFAQVGCASCHRPSIVTGPSDIRALDRVEYRPYSDFLLHDMGPLGDGIAQGGAGGREMRTAPLWGLRFETRYLHDGSAATLDEAIQRHGGQGRPARTRFLALDAGERERILAFLGSL